jgi:IS1 family transposase/transposase-like protein
MILSANNNSTFLREKVMELPKCPECGSPDSVKNGHTPKGKQKHKCTDCGRQFVENPQWQPISKETKDTIKRLLLERPSLAGISRVVQVSQSWLQDYVNWLYAKVSRHISSTENKVSLTLECDELWSFVGNKGNKQWIWLALDRDTREIVGVHIGDRSEAGARALWNSLPSFYQECAMSYTDYWSAYGKVFPAERHKAIGKETGLTNHIERFNCTLRQRCSRLVRLSLSFSKSLENHISAIWYFIHDYNKRINA